MKLCDFKPNPLLAPYINRYWSWQDECHLPDILPGSGAELFFYYQQPANKITVDSHIVTQASSVLIAPRTTRFQFQQHSPLSFISVRFKIGALRHFCPMPTIELTDKLYSVQDLWGNKGEQVLQQVCAAPSHASRIDIIEQFLMSQLAINFKHEHPWLDYAFHQIYYRQSTLDAVIDETHIGVRHFQRVVKQNSGVSPKYLQRIIKIQAVIRYLLLHKKTQYLDCILAHGYYDQSHFIKDFKHFTEQTPTDYFQDANFMSHFYNPPLR